MSYPTLCNTGGFNFILEVQIETVKMDNGVLNDWEGDLYVSYKFRNDGPFVAYRENISTPANALYFSTMNNSMEEFLKWAQVDYVVYQKDQMGTDTVIGYASTSLVNTFRQMIDEVSYMRLGMNMRNINGYEDIHTFDYGHKTIGYMYAKLQLRYFGSNMDQPMEKNQKLNVKQYYTTASSDCNYPHRTQEWENYTLLHKNSRNEYLQNKDTGNVLITTQKGPRKGAKEITLNNAYYVI